MAVGIGSILELRVFQTFLGQEVLNVMNFFVFDRQGGGDGLGGFAEPAALQYYAVFSDQQSVLLEYTRAELSEVNGIQFDQYTYDNTVYTGQGGGDPLPSFAAYGITLRRDTKLTRNGSKRIAGVPESVTVQNAITSPVREALQTAASGYFVGTLNWVDPLSPSRTLGVEPIIWGGNSIAYPDGRFSRIIGVNVNPNVTTQNTRKPGRGS